MRHRFIERALSELRDGESRSGPRHGQRCAWDCPCRYRMDAGLFRAEIPVVELSPDQAARQFIQDSEQVSGFRVMVALLARNWYSVTDANAICRTGSMHILSTGQARRLLGLGDDHVPAPGSTLLDVGAGDGGVTAQLAPLFDQVVATEVSDYMIGRLRERGFRAVLSADPGAVLTETGLGQFDCVACMNVLDRCERPLDLLATLRDLMRPDSSYLILALVLPFRPGVENGTAWRSPLQSLPDPVYSDTFEIAANAVACQVLEPLGLRIEAMTRLPYMSFSVSMTQNYALLDNALFICRRRRPTSPTLS